MSTALLFVHWKQIRIALVPFMAAAFALPLLAVQGMGTPEGMTAVSMQAYRVVGGYQQWLPFFPILATVLGVTLALSAWNWDHQREHVYALSLPLPRWRYAMLKMGAGAALALLPVAAFWVGSLAAAASVSLPSGLHAYPNQLALRFLVATLVAYAVVFAMASGTIRTTVWIITGVIAFLFLGNLLNDYLSVHIAWFQRTNMVEAALRWLWSAPGPFHVFTGNWMLFDV
ncbi:MAG: hypothetical protein PVJ02_12390 [Gemmatimonadota bacterium]|jgi:hypothetical protein